MDTYSSDIDVSSKYSHVKIQSDIVVEDYRAEAYNEINMLLRKLYVIPIDSEDENDTEYLKSIESRLAAGNILIAASSVSDFENINEYGKTLIDQAMEKLKKLTDQEIILTGATKDTDDDDEVINPPKLQGSAPDEYSTFGRPNSGIENDAIEGVVDSKNYNSLEDTKDIA